jgi:uncharacterized OsmC-like protein
MAGRLAQATVTARWIGLQGRAILSTKSHHFVVDSPLALGGPNEEVTPLDLILASVAANAAFVGERVMQEEAIPFERFAVYVTGTFDPRGMRGEPVDPRLRAIHVQFVLAGPTAEQAARVIDAYRARCAIYNTLSCALPIEIELDLASSADAPPATNGRDAALARNR